MVSIATRAMAMAALGRERSSSQSSAIIYEVLWANESRGCAIEKTASATHGDGGRKGKRAVAEIASGIFYILRGFREHYRCLVRDDPSTARCRWRALLFWRQYQKAEWLQRRVVIIGGENLIPKESA